MSSSPEVVYRLVGGAAGPPSHLVLHPLPQPAPECPRTFLPAPVGISQVLSAPDPEPTSRQLTPLFGNHSKPMPLQPPRLLPCPLLLGPRAVRLPGARPS